MPYQYKREPLSDDEVVMELRTLDDLSKCEIPGEVFEGLQGGEGEQTGVVEMIHPEAFLPEIFD